MEHIGIIGFGMVGKTVWEVFSHKYCVDYSDPKYNSITVEDICNLNPRAIFVCLPTPTDDTNYSLITSTLDRIFATGYSGLVVLKSTILPQYIQKYSGLTYNPEFLTRSTALADFLKPVYNIAAGCGVVALKNLYDIVGVDTSNYHVVDVPTACMVKYTMNSFFATKVTFMNGIESIAKTVGADYNAMVDILKDHPWIGSNHMQVPGPDGKGGFGGPCLPKDTEALVKHFGDELLTKVLELNSVYRK